MIENTSTPFKSSRNDFGCNSAILMLLKHWKASQPLTVYLINNILCHPVRALLFINLYLVVGQKEVTVGMRKF
jgi:hypothetical protein